MNSEQLSERRKLVGHSTHLLRWCGYAFISQGAEMHSWEAGCGTSRHLADISTASNTSTMKVQLGEGRK